MSWLHSTHHIGFTSPTILASLQDRRLLKQLVLRPSSTAGEGHPINIAIHSLRPSPHQHSNSPLSLSSSPFMHHLLFLHSDSSRPLSIAPSHLVLLPSLSKSSPLPSLPLCLQPTPHPPLSSLPSSPAGHLLPSFSHRHILTLLPVFMR